MENQLNEFMNSGTIELHRDVSNKRKADSSTTTSVAHPNKMAKTTVDGSVFDPYNYTRILLNRVLDSLHSSTPEGDPLVILPQIPILLLSQLPLSRKIETVKSCLPLVFPLISRRMVDLSGDSICINQENVDRIIGILFASKGYQSASDELVSILLPTPSQSLSHLFQPHHLADLLLLVSFEFLKLFDITLDELAGDLDFVFISSSVRQDESLDHLVDVLASLQTCPLVLKVIISSVILELKRTSHHLLLDRFHGIMHLLAKIYRTRAHYGVIGAEPDQVQSSIRDAFFRGNHEQVLSAYTDMMEGHLSLQQPDDIRSGLIELYRNEEALVKVIAEQLFSNNKLVSIFKHLSAAQILPSLETKDLVRLTILSRPVLDFKASVLATINPSSPNNPPHDSLPASHISASADQEDLLNTIMSSANDLEHDLPASEPEKEKTTSRNSRTKEKEKEKEKEQRERERQREREKNDQEKEKERSEQDRNKSKSGQKNALLRSIDKKNTSSE